MNFAFNSPLIRRRLPLIFILLLLPVLLFWVWRGSVWTTLDMRALDRLYRWVVARGYGVPASERVVYLDIVNETYHHNVLDRRDLARVNSILAALGPESVAYDIIFAHPSEPVADSMFAASITELGSLFLPAAFDLSTHPQSFLWEPRPAYRRLKDDYCHRLTEKNAGQPYWARRAILQYTPFATAAYGSGHINLPPDADGVFRHYLLLIKIDDCIFPSLALAMFLDAEGIAFNQLEIEWGKYIRIPAAGSYLEQDVIIPIDEQGRTYIPFPNVWGADFPHMTVNGLLKTYNDPVWRGGLRSFFSGKFVFIGDASQAGSDFGQTALEQNVPLIAVHAAVMNGLLQNQFYHRWGVMPTLGVIVLLAVLLLLSALPKPAGILYVMGGTIVLSIVGLTVHQLIHFALFPVVSVLTSTAILFFGISTAIKFMMYREQAFIRGAFAHYVPENVVKQIIEQPDRLQLGGEERELTVLFSDLAGFTSFSEQMTPTELVRLLNAYLTEMTQIVLDEGGIIDKYQGDAIMAEFGAPLFVPDHADRALRAALRMQQRLAELRTVWEAQGLPAIRCRIGINTGRMVIGNMGSERVFDYTVIGDAVNLGSRLEGANKQYGSLILISEFTRAALTTDQFLIRQLDVIKVKGKSEAVRVYEVYGERSDPIPEADRQYYHAYQQGLEAYLRRDFASALLHFQSALDHRPQDVAATLMIQRINTLDPAQLPADWDGSVTLTSK